MVVDTGFRATYPNIATIMDKMPDDYAGLAGMYLRTMTVDKLNMLERAIPEFKSAYENGDKDKVSELVTAVGHPELAAPLLAVMDNPESINEFIG